MHEISPVLAGTFDSPDYIAASSNINGGGAELTEAEITGGTSAPDASQKTQDIDPRRYTKWDRTASAVQDDPNFSFGDFLDMINPLQHIPVISSVYREITGDKISPVSRVAGDVLYGGALGAASAIMGGVTAIADAVSESQTGKDVTGVAVAMLFGNDKDQTTQLADVKKTDPVAQTDTMLALSAPVQPVQQAAQAGTPAVKTLASATGTGMALPQQKAFALDQTKRLPYGGVMDTGKNYEAQDMAIALSEGSHAMRLGNTIYTSPLMTGSHGQPVTRLSNPDLQKTAVAQAANAPAATDTASPATAAAVPGPAATAQASAAQAAQTPGHNPLPQNLIDDMVMMKALSQYKGVAAGPASLGGNYDMSN